MSDAPERIKLELRQSFSSDFWCECRDTRYAKSGPVEYLRADLATAAVAAAREEGVRLGLTAAWILALRHRGNTETPERIAAITADPARVAAIAAQKGGE